MGYRKRREEGDLAQQHEEIMIPKEVQQKRKNKERVGSGPRLYGICQLKGASPQGELKDAKQNVDSIRYGMLILKKHERRRRSCQHRFLGIQKTMTEIIDDFEVNTC